MRRKFLIVISALILILAAFQSCNMTVGNNDNSSESSISLSISRMSLTQAVATVTSQTITATLTNSSSSVVWSSSNSGVVSITDNGANTATIYAMGDGSANVCAMTANGKLSAVCAVTVELGSITAHSVSNLEVSGEPTSSTVVLTWTDSTDATGVKIVCVDGTGNIISTTYVDTGIETVTVSDLYENTEYTFYVYGVINAETDEETLSDSVSVQATTAEDLTAPAGVTNASYSSVGDHSVKLTWTDPDDDDFAYVVITSATENLDGDAISETVAAGTGAATISSLVANTSYTFTLATEDKFGNVQGDSNNEALVPATVTVATSADTTDPGNVTGVSVKVNSITSVTLTWTDPTDTDLENIIISAASETGGVSAPDDVTIAAGVNTATITVSSGANYTFTLKTEDYDGNTGSGVEVTASTEPLASSVSSQFAYNGEAVEITWTDTTAVEDGETYTYTVTAATTDGASAGSVTSIATGTQEATFTGLSAGTSYTFTVSTVRSSDSAVYSSDDTTITATAATLDAVVLTNQYNGYYLLPSSSTSIIFTSSTASGSYSDVWVIHSALDGTSTFTYSTDSTTGTVDTFSLEATDVNGIPTGEYLYLKTVSSSNTSWTAASAALGSKSTVTTSYSTLASFFLGGIQYSSGNYTSCIRLTYGSGYFMMGGNSTTDGGSLYYRYSTGAPGVSQGHWYYNQVSTAD